MRNEKTNTAGLILTAFFIVVMPVGVFLILTYFLLLHRKNSRAKITDKDHKSEREIQLERVSSGEKIGDVFTKEELGVMPLSHLLYIEQLSIDSHARHTERQ
jgi:uncharacterized membrane protein